MLSRWRSPSPSAHPSMELTAKVSAYLSEMPHFEPRQPRELHRVDFDLANETGFTGAAGTTSAAHRRW